MPKRDAPISIELQELGRGLKRFRKAHAPRRRLPEELWAAAVEVAGRGGIYQTARSLRLDYANLKRRVEAAPSDTATKRSNRAHSPSNRVTAPSNRVTAPTGFVEMLADSIGADCLIEVESANGRMRVQMKLTAPEVMSLVRDWQAGGANRREDRPS